jgi:hypothetical protein
MNMAANALKESRAVLAERSESSSGPPVKLIKEALESGRFLIYITARLSYETLNDVIKSEINENEKNVLFIDMISRTSSGRPERRGNCVFTNAPTNLTDVAMMLSQALIAYQKRGVVVILDDINSLAIYNPTPTVIKFVRFAIMRSRELGASALLMYSSTKDIENVVEALKEEVDEKIML